jgi:hypothetical protein
LQQIFFPCWNAVARTVFFVNRDLFVIIQPPAGNRNMINSILVCETETDFAARTDPGKRGEYWAAYSA